MMSTCKIEDEANKHPYADMIIEKVLNMDLFVFIKSVDGWIKCSIGFPSWTYGNDYFICHPKHAKAVLHSLNGGEVEAAANGSDKFFEASAENWNPNLWCMQENWDSRIVEEKPEPEVKKWVGLHESGMTCGPIFGKEMPNPAPDCGWSFVEDVSE